jgi:site-specific recombinase XerD
MASLYRRNDIYWISFYKNSKHHCQSLKTKDRATANYLKSKIEQELAEGKYIIHEEDPTCDKILKEYLSATEHYKTNKTNKDDEARIKAFLSYVGIININQITEKKLQDYLNHRISEDRITLNTANRIISSIKAWLNFAIRRKYIFSNPVKDFKKYKSPQNPPKFLTKEEVKQILDASRNTYLYPTIFTALYTGMRRKELYFLEWQDIDFERNIIIVRNKEGFLIKSKKFRVIPLHNKLKEFLQPLCKGIGKCFNSTNHKHLFPRIIKKAGLKKVGFHHFRHTFASHLCLQGVDLYTIAQLLGHSNITVTQQYAHLTKDHIKASVEKLNF